MPKRLRGMVKRGNAYYLRLRPQGKEKWISLGSEFSEADLRYRQLKALGPRLIRQPTVKSLSETWVREYVGTRRNQQGQKLASQRLRDHILPVLGNKLLCEVTTADIRRLRVAVEAKDLSPRTVCHVLSDVRCLFGYAVNETRVIDKSPFTRRLMPVVQEKEPVPLSEREIARVLQMVSTKHQLLIRLALETGLRYGELRSLRWEDVVFCERPHVIVRRSHDGPTKSRKVRRVPLTKTAEILLRGATRRSEWIFPGRSDGRIGRDPGRLNEFIKKSVPDFHFHRLRHTFACRFLEGGGSSEALRVILGHSTVRLTERYGRLSDVAVWEETRSLSSIREKTGDDSGDEAPLAPEREMSKI